MKKKNKMNNGMKKYNVGFNWWWCGLTWPVCFAMNIFNWCELRATSFLVWAFFFYIYIYAFCCVRCCTYLLSTISALALFLLPWEMLRSSVFLLPCFAKNAADACWMAILLGFENLYLCTMAMEWRIKNLMECIDEFVTFHSADKKPEQCCDVRRP